MTHSACIPSWAQLEERACHVIGAAGPEYARECANRNVAKGTPKVKLRRGGFLVKHVLRILKRLK
jgi:hypothetical protein